MRYYDEQKMGQVRRTLEAKMGRWSGVKTRRMFGCPCYTVNGKLYAFLTTGHLVLTQLAEEHRARLAEQVEVKPFRAGRKIMSAWTMTPITEEHLDHLLPFIRQSCAAARQAGETQN